MGGQSVGRDGFNFKKMWQFSKQKPAPASFRVGGISESFQFSFTDSQMLLRIPEGKEHRSQWAGKETTHKLVAVLDKENFASQSENTMTFLCGLLPYWIPG